MLLRSPATHTVSLTHYNGMGAGRLTQCAFCNTHHGQVSLRCGSCRSITTIGLLPPTFTIGLLDGLLIHSTVLKTFRLTMSLTTRRLMYYMRQTTLYGP